MQNPTRRQHLIPKFHLKEFSLNGHINCVEKESGKITSPTLGDQVFLETELWDHRLENTVLRKIESDFHNKFRTTGPPGLRHTPSKETLFYIASLMARTRLKAKPISPLRLSKAVGATIGKMDDNTKREMELENQIIIDEGGVIHERHAKGIILENEIIQIVKHLNKREWECLYLTDEYEFALSDRFLIEFPIVALSPKALYYQPSDVLPSGSRFTNKATSKHLSEMFNSIIMELSEVRYFYRNSEAVRLGDRLS